MNVVSLFTGVGGFDLGLERAGHRIVAQCEADEKARAVLRRHWPDVPIHDDVCGFDGGWMASVGLAERYGDRPRSDDGPEHGNGKRSGGSGIPVDLVCGGFPCQDLSVAGKRAGLAGERSGLFFEAARISDLVLGDGGWVPIENVPGLLSSNGGRDFAVVLATLADLGFHDLAWRVLDSRFFGVPQRRRRVFILARRASGRHAAEVLLEPESGGGNHQAGRQTGKGSAGRVIDGPSGTLGSLSGRFRTTDLDGQGAFIPQTAPRLSTKYGEAAGQDLGQPGALVADGSLREPTSRGQGNALCPTTDDGRRQTGASLPDGQDGAISPPPDTDGMRTPPGIPGRMDDPVTAFHATQTPIHSTDHAPALGSSAQIGVMGSGGTDTACPYDPKPDGPRYAQMGNAVTVNVAQWIGERLRDFG